MLKLNEETASIEIIETFDFEAHVEPRLKEIKNDLAYDMDCFSDEDQKNLNSFLNKKEWSHEDKIQILKEIQEYFEVEDNYYADVSIFSERIIDEGIFRWVEDVYEVDIRP